MIAFLFWACVAFAAGLVFAGWLLFTCINAWSDFLYSALVGARRGSR